MGKFLYILRNIKEYGFLHEYDKYREMWYLKKAIQEKERKAYLNYNDISQKDLEEMFLPHPNKENRQKTDRLLGPNKNMSVKIALLGSIYGDILGSQFEFSHPKESITPDDLPQILSNGHFTDDTVLTLATCDVFKNGILFETSYNKWGSNYPGAGYGGAFFNWLLDDVKKPYNSFGNGSAMRISPCALISSDCREIIHWAYESAKVTHNHYEGIKGAIVTAVCIYLARFYEKEDIEAYLIRHYGQNIHNEYLSGLYKTGLFPSKEWEEYLEYNSEYYFNARIPFSKMKNMVKAWPVSCMDTVPFALRCVIDSKDYDDFICNIINYGQDTDTEACIGGTIAAILYGLPEKYPTSSDELNKWLKEDMIDLLNKYSESRKINIPKKYEMHI